MIGEALAHRPELLILDEPTAGMDLAGREQVLATVDQILKQPDAPTVLMITHHVEELSPRTSQVLLMRDGLIIADGKPQDVITPESLTATFGCKVFVKRRTAGIGWRCCRRRGWIWCRGGDGGRLFNYYSAANCASARAPVHHDADRAERHRPRRQHRVEVARCRDGDQHALYANAQNSPAWMRRMVARLSRMCAGKARKSPLTRTTWPVSMVMSVAPRLRS